MIARMVRPPGPMIMRTCSGLTLIETIRGAYFDSSGRGAGIRVRDEDPRGRAGRIAIVAGDTYHSASQLKDIAFTQRVECLQAEGASNEPFGTRNETRRREHRQFSAEAVGRQPGCNEAAELHQLAAHPVAARQVVHGDPG